MDLNELDPSYKEASMQESYKVWLKHNFHFSDKKIQGNYPTSRNNVQHAHL